jgi:ribosome assembly protein 4
LRIGPYDHKGNCADTPEGMLKAAQDKYDKVYAAGGNRELLVSCSDDFTGFLWDPVNTDKPIVRLIGHQQPINYIAFSPDGRIIATGGFDKAVKLWNGLTGKFMASLRGHVQSVYQLAWSADSRLLVSASKDSTMKVWNIQKRTMDTELPGHADEVFAADWSPDGIKVVSGGKDCILKIWRR